MTPLVTPDDVKALYDELLELDEGGGSSNDFTHAVDDWFVKHGYPTIIYREKR
jgi:hypothetical protein